MAFVGIAQRSCFCCKRRTAPELSSFPPLGQYASLCRDCIGREQFKLITKTEAQTRFNVSDRDLLDLLHLPKKNSFGGKHPIKLFLESQVVALAERRDKERAEDRAKDAALKERAEDRAKDAALKERAEVRAKDAALKERAEVRAKDAALQGQGSEQKDLAEQVKKKRGRGTRGSWVEPHDEGQVRGESASKKQRGGDALEHPRAGGLDATT